MHLHTDTGMCTSERDYKHVFRAPDDILCCPSLTTGGVLRHIDSLLQQTLETIQEASGCTAEEVDRCLCGLSLSLFAFLCRCLSISELRVRVLKPAMKRTYR